jgi:hypothetical protein
VKSVVKQQKKQKTNEERKVMNDKSNELGGNPARAVTHGVSLNNMNGCGSSEQGRFNTVKRLSVIKTVALALGCAALVSGSGRVSATGTLPANAANLVANAGITFVFTPTSDPSVFDITADGVVQSSLLGNGTDHAELVVRFPAPGSGQPITLNGTATLTSSDGANSLRLTLTGIATPDPANPAFFNVTYQVTFMGGSGAFASARGVGGLDEVVKFSSQLAGTGTWTMKGYVITPPAG